MWVKYRHMEGDVSGNTVDASEFDDFDYVSFGALINF
jgi:hypothetical protein